MKLLIHLVNQQCRQLKQVELGMVLYW